MAQESFQLDLSEKGKDKDGQVISLDRRLFMQLLAYGACRNTGALIEALQQANLEGVLYADINDPQGVALLILHEDPNYFVGELRQWLNQPAIANLTPKPEYTMLGRTYSLGYEQDLEATLLTRPRRRVLDPEWPWAIWYPLRRVKNF